MNQFDSKSNQQLDQDNLLIMDYRYGELNAAQIENFEQRLNNDQDFKRLFNSLNQLDNTLAQGSKPAISKERMNAVHWNLNKKLRSHNNKVSIITTALNNLRQKGLGFTAQLAGMAATFVLGWSLSGGFVGDTQQPETIAQLSDKHAPLSLVKQAKFDITDLQVKQVDMASGEVELIYSAAAKTHLTGNLANHEIQSLLIESVKHDESDATRLDLIDVLKDYTNNKNVKEALSYSLLNDPNPGVRMAAAEALANLAASSQVRETLRSALSKDVNPGVRVEAFQALAPHLDEAETSRVFQEHAVKDSNSFIRNQSQSLLKKRTGSTQI